MRRMVFHIYYIKIRKLFFVLNNIVILESTRCFQQRGFRGTKEKNRNGSVEEKKLLRVIPAITFHKIALDFNINQINSSKSGHTTHLLRYILLFSVS